MRIVGLGIVLLLGLGQGALGGQSDPEIWLRPSVGPEERARRDAEEKVQWERTRREVGTWRRRFDPAVRPVRRAAGEALRSLRIHWGPDSRNLGYQVLLEAERFRSRAILPAPDPQLDAQLRRALAELEQGAAFCLQGMPTRAQLRMEQALRRMDLALAVFAEEFDPRGPVRLRQAGSPRCGMVHFGVTLRHAYHRETSPPKREPSPGHRPPRQVACEVEPHEHQPDPRRVGRVGPRGAGAGEETLFRAGGPLGPNPRSRGAKPPQGGTGPHDLR